jgi:hypothetical protein
MESRFSYDSKTHFIRCLNKYKDKGSSHIPEELIAELDDYMQKHLNFPPASEIRKMPLDSEGKRGVSIKFRPKPSIEILRDVLKYTANTRYYGDLNLITRMLWGWELIGEEKVQKLIEEYAKLTKIYEKIDKPIPYKDIVFKPPTEEVIKEFKRMAREIDDDYLLI